MVDTSKKHRTRNLRLVFGVTTLSWSKTALNKKRTVITTPGCNDITIWFSFYWLTRHQEISSSHSFASLFFCSEMFPSSFSPGLPRCIVGTEVSHQVSTTVALSSAKLLVTKVTNTQVSGRNLKKVWHHISLSSDVTVFDLEVCLLPSQFSNKNNEEDTSSNVRTDC